MQIIKIHRPKVKLKISISENGLPNASQGSIDMAEAMINSATMPVLVLNCRSEKSAEFAKKHLKKFVEKGNGISDAEAGHIIDWLDSDASPKRVAKMSVPQAIDGAKKWQEAMNKKKAVAEDADGIEEVFKHENFRVVKLLSEQAFKREGNLMKHCVASYFGRTDCIIYSLRDENNKPHCTMELGFSNYPHDKPQNERAKFIRQIRGQCNQHVKPDYVSAIKAFLVGLGLEIGENQMGYLGYETFPAKWVERLIARGHKLRNVVVAGSTFILKDDLAAIKAA